MSNNLKQEENFNCGKRTFLSDFSSSLEVGNHMNKIYKNLYLSLVEKAKKHYKYFLLELEIELDEEKKRRKQIDSQLESFLIEMLEVLDFWEGVLELVRIDKYPVDKDIKSLVEGFQQGVRLFQKKLIKIRVESYEPKVGELFIPGKHYCIGTEACEKLPEGVVCKLVKKGYTWEGQLLRPAYVITVKNQKRG